MEEEDESNLELELLLDERLELELLLEDNELLLDELKLELELDASASYSKNACIPQRYPSLLLPDILVKLCLIFIFRVNFGGTT